MAKKNPATPIPVGPAPPVPQYTKRSGYSPEQSNQRAGSSFYDPGLPDVDSPRPDWYPPEPRPGCKRSESADKVRSWGNGSYDPVTGRAASVSASSAPGKTQAQSSGPRTPAGSSPKPMRPGRY